MEIKLAEKEQSFYYLKGHTVPEQIQHQVIEENIGKLNPFSW